MGEVGETLSISSHILHHPNPSIQGLPWCLTKRHKSYFHYLLCVCVLTRFAVVCRLPYRKRWNAKNDGMTKRWNEHSRSVYKSKAHVCFSFQMNNHKFIRTRREFIFLYSVGENG